MIRDVINKGIFSEQPHYRVDTTGRKCEQNKINGLGIYLVFQILHIGHDAFLSSSLTINLRDLGPGDIGY